MKNAILIFFLMGLGTTALLGQDEQDHSRILLRNANLKGEFEPLIVIDDIVYDSLLLASSDQKHPLALVNPNDIETVKVLRYDSALALLYGEKAKNGVVIVSTKKGNFKIPKPKRDK